MTVLAAHPIVHLNASLNALAMLLLLVGLAFVRRGNVTAHQRAMLAAFGVSAVFLGCYVWYHALVGSVRFTHPGAVRYVYLVILASHVLLAAAVPFLAVWQIYLGYRAIGCCRQELPLPDEAAQVTKYLERHRRWAWWTFPIWLYVSATGVVVYLMLYHLWPPG